jgi:hypothetical protein
MKKRKKLSDVELSKNCRQLKLESSDGKKYETDCADTQCLLRIIQSTSSPKAEPLKQWLAKTAYKGCRKFLTPHKALTGHEKTGNDWTEAIGGFYRPPKKISRQYREIKNPAETGFQIQLKVVPLFVGRV